MPKPKLYRLNSSPSLGPVLKFPGPKFRAPSTSRSACHIVSRCHRRN